MGAPHSTKRPRDSKTGSPKYKSHLFKGVVIDHLEIAASIAASFSTKAPAEKIEKVPEPELAEAPPQHPPQQIDKPSKPPLQLPRGPYSVIHADILSIMDAADDLEREFCPSILREMQLQIRHIMTMPRSAPAFQISDALYADSTPVFIGRPMRFAYDLAIPVFTKHDGRTHLTFAYRSESRAVWRRFSGCLEGTYYRGSNERFQDFHWSIQKALDSASHIPAIEMKDSSGSLKKLHELDIWEKGYGDPILDLISSRLIREGENLLQESMARNAKPFVASYEPETFVAYWWAGAQESIYGPHVKLLVESQCNQYLYGVSITADGIFVSFVHDNDSNGITTAGSPAAGVLVTGYRNLFSPIVEHTENIGDQPLMEQLVELPNSGIGRTLVGISGRQICAEDLHESDKSPFRKLYNAVRVITRLLRQGSYEAADLRLQAIKNGTAPLLSDEAPSMPPQDKLQRAAEKRFEILADAYQLHSQGKLDQVEIGKHRLLPRDVQLIKKYFEQQKLTQAAQPEISAKICQSIAYERLRKVAVQWARDALESSSHSTWDGTSMPPT